MKNDRFSVPCPPRPRSRAKQRVDTKRPTNRPHAAALTARPAAADAPDAVAVKGASRAAPAKVPAPLSAPGEVPVLPPTPEQVFREYAPRVYSIAWRMLGNEADAEDVTQDVLLQVVRKLDTFRGDSSLATWLHRITVNAALALRRKQACRKERQVSDPMEQFLGDGSHAGTVRSWSLPPEQVALGRELRQLIEGAIAGLPELYRDVYVLADVEGLPNAEIGDMLGLGLAAVKSRLHRARLMMREALAPHFQERRA